MRILSRLCLVAFVFLGVQGYAQTAARADVPDAPSAVAIEAAETAIDTPQNDAALIAEAFVPDLHETRPRLDETRRLEPQSIPVPARTFVHYVTSRDCAEEQASRHQCGVHWKPLLAQSFQLLLTQNAAHLATDPAARYNVSHGPWFNNWLSSAGDVRMTRWNNGESAITNYVARPMAGAMAAFVYIQNDPKGRDLGFHNRREYWASRFDAMLYAAAYNAQWQIGPLGKASLGNAGKSVYDPASGRVVNHSGAIDFVMTPLVGTVWAVGEDLIDRHVIWNLEARTNNKAALLAMSLLNPNRTVANLLRGRAPWYRDYRETRIAHLTLPFQAPKNSDAAGN